MNRIGVRDEPSDEPFDISVTELLLTELTADQWFKNTTKK